MAHEEQDRPEDDGVEERSGSRLGMVAGALAVGCLVIAVLVVGWVVLDGDPADPGTAAGDVGVASDGGTASSEPTGTPSAADPEAAVAGTPPATERCVQASEALATTLSRAHPALEQWSVHVGAMNQLVVGEITLQQATAFWDRTRVGAQRGVTAFRRAWNALAREGVDCPRPILMGAGTSEVRPCARQVREQLAVLRAARTSIATWRTHVHHMDMLRLGTLSPEDATEMWLSMWQSGVRDLDAYEAAARRAQRERGCHHLAAGG